ncbi:hypothetical protein [Streptomyces sp. NPDC048565]|uniref:hypothetical protein n=1 Tax=Streptomyces sp. NPDC048565 TaxID=3155266 RepID=UPI003441A90E
MNTRHIARTARSAGLVAVAAAAALALTACQSGGTDAASGSDKKDSASAPASTSGKGEDTSKVGTLSGKSKAGTGSPVSTEPLPDGSTAKIYELGSQHYRADLVDDGEVFASLETDEHDAGLDANDMFVVVTLGGQLHSWMGGGQTGPGTFDLAGGWKAKVTKTGTNGFRAEILGSEGAVEGTLTAKDHDAGVDANGVGIVLTAGGVISAHE